METKFYKAITLTVGNFTDYNSEINSPPFLSGGCEWIVTANLKGNTVDNFLFLFLSVNEPKSLGLDWKRRASFYFVLLNQSGQETFTTKVIDQLFCADSFTYGFQKAFLLNKVLDKRVLVNDSFSIKIYIKVVDGSKKEVNSDEFKIPELEEQVKDLELTMSGLKVKLDKERASSSRDYARILSLEQTLTIVKVKSEIANDYIMSLKASSSSCVGSQS